MTIESKYFLLGTLIGFAFGIWTVYLFVRFLVERQKERVEKDKKT